MMTTTASEKNVGIVALEVYTPRNYVEQSELEEHNGVAAGKYTIGLGQEGLALTGDAEDINSVCLTVVHSLLEKYNIDPNEVGRLEVGTETLVDKSKSTKTVLMDLFPGNTDMEGATVVNACYGGTAALLNAFCWCESEGWDGRYAIVVAADIATYAAGPARPTCGCGAVAVLVGRDAPLAFVNPRQKATHAAHVWDFFKPNHEVEYPVVDGALSQVCYYQALEDVYSRFCQRMQATTGKNFYTDDKQQQQEEETTAADYYCFHSPYNKLVQKSFARLFFMDARRRHEARKKAGNNNIPEQDAALAEWLDKPVNETHSDKALEKVLKQLSAQAYKDKMTDSNAASILVGNTYTASVFLGLASLVDRAKLIPGQSVVLFSYGSGALATMYRLQVRQPTTTTTTTASSPLFSVEAMAKAMDLTNRLSTREKVHPAELDRALDTRARMHTAGAPYKPVYPTNRLFPGTYYLVEVDDKWRRSYKRVPLDAVPVNDVKLPLAPQSVLDLEDSDAEEDLKKTDATTEITTNSSSACSMVTTASVTQQQMSNGATAGNSHVCMITGMAAGLPGTEPVFAADNVERLLDGTNCIKPISDHCKQSMLDKNIVQVVRKRDSDSHKVTTQPVPLQEPADMIQLAAQLAPFDLTKSYGVPVSLAKTMDTAAQVAVAAGLEALKNAGLVSGQSADPAEWKIAPEYRDTTGVIYASSFPAMDSAVGEVVRYLQSQSVSTADAIQLVDALRNRLLEQQPHGQLSTEDEAALDRLTQQCCQDKKTKNAYAFDRKFLFRVLVLGNAQLAQLVGCRGPNTQTNAACAGTTQALAIAQDMLTTGRAERIVVIAGDNAAGDVLMPWLGSGFRILGAATNKSVVEEAACPFDKRRSGMILGAGGTAMVLETAASVQKRQIASHFSVQARLLATHYCNSAYHGAALDQQHIGQELDKFLSAVENDLGITRAEIAQQGVYFSHETCTHASPAQSCAANEISALRAAFGDELLSNLLLLNTKGYTGHPMGVSFEDIAAVACLQHQRVPAVANYCCQDDYLGANLKISRKAGPYNSQYALRFAAGFGSQVAFCLYGTADTVSL